MAPEPIIFAMANPTPEISYEEAKAARPDCIMATGRSDYPNQVNNVLGFPFIFRGALDVRSTEINEAMKLGAVKALAELAKKPVPDIVNMAYNNDNLNFGKDYIIPKPVDPRLISSVAPAVAKAAMDSGVAKRPIKDWEQYKNQLELRLGHDNSLSKIIETKAKQDLKKVVFADAEDVSILKAVQQVVEEKIAQPILLGNIEVIGKLMKENNIELPNVKILNPKIHANEEEAKTFDKYVQLFYEKRRRKGLILSDAHGFMRTRSSYAAMMVETGAADAMIGGQSRKFADTLKPALQIIGPREGVKKVASVHIAMTKQGPLFLADTSINHFLDANDIAEITELVAEKVQQFNIEPKIALVTYSNFGSVSKGKSGVLMRKATQIVHEKHPDWIVDGEMQAIFALDPDLLQKYYPFSKLAGHAANTLIFPSLSSANLAYNLLGSVGKLDITGPIILGMKKPAHILQMGATVRQIVEMVGIAAIDAQT